MPESVSGNAAEGQNNIIPRRNGGCAAPDIAGGSETAPACRTSDAEAPALPAGTAGTAALSGSTPPRKPGAVTPEASGANVPAG